MSTSVLIKLKKYLSPLFEEAASTLLKDKDLSDRKLDAKAMELLKSKSIKTGAVKINFSGPKDTMYNAEAGRAPYDMLIFGFIEGVPFKIFLNNKLGNIRGTTRNDTTTYNNLLRLYLDVKDQRLGENEELEQDVIAARIKGKEVVSYAIFVVDNQHNEHRLYFFEELADSFYVNPRNHMFQTKYSPTLRQEPMDYSTFILRLISASDESLDKLIENAETEKKKLIQFRNEIVKYTKEKN